MRNVKRISKSATRLKMEGFVTKLAHVRLNGLSCEYLIIAPTITALRELFERKLLSDGTKFNSKMVHTFRGTAFKRQ